MEYPFQPFLKELLQLIGVFHLKSHPYLPFILCQKRAKQGMSASFGFKSTSTGLLRKFQLHDKFWNDFLNIYYLNSDYLDSVVLCLLRLSYMRQWRRTSQFSIQKYFFAASVTPYSKSGEVHSKIMLGLLHSSQEGKYAWECFCKGTQNEPQPLASNRLLRTANLGHTHKHIRVTVDAYIVTAPNLLSKLF